MTMDESTKLNEKIALGIKLAIERLIEKTKREDGDLVISIKGKITKVKARELRSTEN